MQTHTDQIEFIRQYSDVLATEIDLIGENSLEEIWTRKLSDLQSLLKNPDVAPTINPETAFIFLGLLDRELASVRKARLH